MRLGCGRIGAIGRPLAVVPRASAPAPRLRPAALWRHAPGCRRVRRSCRGGWRRGPRRRSWRAGCRRCSRISAERQSLLASVPRRAGWCRVAPSPGRGVCPRPQRRRERAAGGGTPRRAETTPSRARWRRATRTKRWSPGSRRRRRSAHSRDRAPRTTPRRRRWPRRAAAR